eukprot:jgi/Ulvmu1/8295/UM041_0107.1
MVVTQMCAAWSFASATTQWEELQLDACRCCFERAHSAVQSGTVQLVSRTDAETLIRLYKQLCQRGTAYSDVLQAACRNDLTEHISKRSSQNRSASAAGLQGSPLLELSAPPNVTPLMQAPEKGRVFKTHLFNTRDLITSRGAAQQGPTPPSCRAERRGHGYAEWSGHGCAEWRGHGCAR